MSMFEDRDKVPRVTYRGPSIQTVVIIGISNHNSILVNSNEDILKTCNNESNQRMELPLYWVFSVCHRCFLIQNKL